MILNVSIKIRRQIRDKNRRKLWEVKMKLLNYFYGATNIWEGFNFCEIESFLIGIMNWDVCWHEKGE